MIMTYIYIINTNYNPGNISNTALENYLYATRLELCKISFQKFRDNLSKTKRAALISLRNEPSISIKKADKSRSTTVVVWNRTNFIAEGHEQLHDGIHYAEIRKDKAQDIHSLVNSAVSEMYSNSYIDKITLKYLSQPHNFLPSRLYLLLKIH